MISTTFQPILEKHNYCLLVGLSDNSIRLRLKVDVNPLQSLVYETQIKSLTELGKVSEYCDSLADVKQYIKNPSNIEINSKEATLTINAKNPMKQEKLIQLTVVKLVQVVEESTKSMTIQKRVTAIEKNLEQISYILKNHKHEIKAPQLPEYVSKLELVQQISKIRNLVLETQQSGPPSMIGSTRSFSMDRNIQNIAFPIDRNTQNIDIIDFRSSSFSQSVANFGQVDEKIRNLATEINRQLGDKFQRINQKLSQLDARKADKKDITNFKPIVLPQKPFAKKPTPQPQQPKNQSDQSEEGQIKQLVKTAKAENWDSLQKQTTLDLISKRLAKFPQALSKLTNIAKLNVSFNQISQLPENLGKLVNLSYLNVSNNSLSVLPASMGDLSSLQELWISNNNIRKFPDIILKLTNLKGLFYQSNKLEEIPEQIGGLANLQKLSVRGNRLKILPSSLVNLSKLQWLSISDNDIPNLPYNLGDLKNLKYLYMSFVKLASLPLNFSNLTNILELTMTITHNSPIKLSTIPINQLTSLQKIRIDHYKNSKEEQAQFQQICWKRNIDLKWST